MRAHGANLTMWGNEREVERLPMPHLQFPLQCTCSHRRWRSAAHFARVATRLVRPDGAAALVAGPAGVVVLAETEAALDRPVHTLRAHFGAGLRIGPVRVRYREESCLQEPHMVVRVLCGREHFEPVRADLMDRGASIIDADVIARVGVVRAGAPLRVLLGYGKDLADLTAGWARHVMCLSHYAPVIPRSRHGEAAWLAQPAGPGRDAVLG